MESIKSFTGKTVALPHTDVDTDQIIPARYLKVTDKKGLGEVVFYDWRYDADGKPKDDFVLNKPAAQGATILVAGHNFGCGSSREHAPWALTGFGFQAIVSTQFADIFRNNSLKNGLLPIVVDKATHEQLLDLAAEDPDLQLSVDLETQTLTLPDGRKVEFPIDSFSKECLLNGVDELGYLLRQTDAIEQYEKANNK
ncbi:MAG: 3-isopropylmalate dehydratase small subunit [Chloroflexi bacterium]|nr:3-isopropylmalate dehydratase small subunit [Chloroflexota bacterium]